MVVYSRIEHAPPCVECPFIEKPPWLKLEADGYGNPSPKMAEAASPRRRRDGVPVISPQEYVSRPSNGHESASLSYNTQWCNNGLKWWGRYYAKVVVVHV